MTRNAWEKTLIFRVAPTQLVTSSVSKSEILTNHTDFDNNDVDLLVSRSCLFNHIILCFARLWVYYFQGYYGYPYVLILASILTIVLILWRNLPITNWDDVSTGNHPRLCERSLIRAGRISPFGWKCTAPWTDYTTQRTPKSTSEGHGDGRKEINNTSVDTDW